jgi:glycosyltransferase involved in cell wall biosynthesis
VLQRRVRWLAVSPTAAATLASATGTSVDRIRVVPNPVDPARVVAEPVAHAGVRIAYLGQPLEIKGFPLLGPIIERVERDDVAFDLFLSPPPANLPLELRPPWDALFTAAEGRQVVLFGQQADVRPIYAETDIVLCPSRNESFNRIAVEAMLNGIPVVASDLPAHRTLLGDEEAGLLFPVDEADAAAAALYRLIDDAALRARLGERGRVRAQAYLPERIVPKLLAAYRAG